VKARELSLAVCEARGISCCLQILDVKLLALDAGGDTGYWESYLNLVEHVIKQSG